ncbi:MAG: HNH endonuclease [Lewinellaceae bacterium]|nr:HNH endonuclease [Saprospiraceae bacterium]MCB9334154.1 HNH endonuclease [Lewinellaceae bacterium]
MIKLPNHIQPDQAVLDQLGDWQAEITGTFAEQSTLAKKKFKSRNTKQNATLRKVKDALTQMCAGARRCVYCEDSIADEVEHIAPKDLYPELTFVWENYVYACGNCNGPKNNKFAVFRRDNNTLQKLNPPDWPKETQPPPGEPVLINPRVDDPMKFALLDLKGTFTFVQLPNTDNAVKQRFEYSFEEVLRLNHQEREFLREAREEAFGDYKARLVEYDKQKHRGVSRDKLDKLIAGIRKKNHPTVWREMQRWQQEGWLAQVDTDLNQLFLDNPEALTW